MKVTLRWSTDCGLLLGIRSNGVSMTGLLDDAIDGCKEKLQADLAIKGILSLEPQNL